MAYVMSLEGAGPRAVVRDRSPQLLGPSTPQLFGAATPTLMGVVDTFTTNPLAILFGVAVGVFLARRAR